MATNKVEKEVLKALGTGFKKQGTKEDRAKYLVRIAESVSELDEDVYDTFSSEVKDWYEACVAAAKKKKDAPDFDEVEKKESSKPAKAKGKKAAKDDDDDDSDDDDDADDDDDDDDSDSDDDDDSDSEDDDADSDDDDDDDDADDDDDDSDSDDDDADSDDDSDDDDDANADDDSDSDDDDDDDDGEEDVAAQLKSLTVNDKVKIKTDDGVVKGVVVKALPRLVNVKGRDGVVVKCKLDDIESIEVIAKAEPVDDEKNAKAGKERISGTGEKIRTWVLANYAITDVKKAMKLAEKAIGKFNPSTFKLMHSEAHKWIDAYKALKKSAAK